MQFLMFHQEENTIFYLLQDLAFVPIQVITATIILNQILNVVETRKKIKKINVIISTFFIEVGTPILQNMASFNRNQKEFHDIITIDSLEKNKVAYLKKQVAEHQFDVYADQKKLERLHGLLGNNKDYMLTMLANPNLLEHDSFTDMLWSVFHVADELQSRDSFENLIEEDIIHLSNDIYRAYRAMILEWIHYMNYLQEEYPYLYSLEVRKLPGWLDQMTD